MHQECAASQASRTYRGVPQAIAALLLLLLAAASRVVGVLLGGTLVAVATLSVAIAALLGSAVAALLLGVARSGIVGGTLACLLVHEEPALFLSVPLSEPWRGNGRWLW